MPRDHPYTSGARRQDVGSFVTNIDTWQYVTLSVTETWPAGHCSLLCNMHINTFVWIKRANNRNLEKASTHICKHTLFEFICLWVFCNNPRQHLSLSASPELLSTRCWHPPAHHMVTPAPGSPCRHHHQGRKNVGCMIHYKIIINHFPPSALSPIVTLRVNLHSALCHTLGNSQISSASISVHPWWPVDN